MSKADNKPGAEPSDPDCPLSATGMFLGAFQRELDSTEEQASVSAEGAPFPPMQTPPVRLDPGRSGSTGGSTSEAKPGAPGDFTQLFGTGNPAAPPTKAPGPPVRAEIPDPEAGEVTRIFAPPRPPLAERQPEAPANVPRMRGFSSPGASDSASADGSFTQMFRTIPPPPTSSPQTSPRPPAVDKGDWPQRVDSGTNSKTAIPSSESMGVTELFRALSAADKSPEERDADQLKSFAQAKPAPPSSDPAESFTVLIQKLSERVSPSQPADSHQLTQQPAIPLGQGEYTRIITREEIRAAVGGLAPQAAAQPKVQSAVAGPPNTAPKPDAPAALPSRSKLQEMAPILLIINAFLLVVVIILVIFALLRK